MVCWKGIVVDAAGVQTVGNHRGSKNVSPVSVKRFQVTVCDLHRELGLTRTLRIAGNLSAIFDGDTKQDEERRDNADCHDERAAFFSLGSSFHWKTVRRER